MYRELFVNQRADWSYNLDLKYANSAPINVAGYSFSGSLSKSYASANVDANLTITIANSARGNVVLSLNAAATSNLSAQKYVYDVKMTDSSNNVTRILEGIISLSPGVTR